MKKCRHCVHEAMMKELLQKWEWLDRKTHPCMGCARFPKLRKLTPDHYKDVREEKKNE